MPPDYIQSQYSYVGLSLFIIKCRLRSYYGNLRSLSHNVKYIKAPGLISLEFPTKRQVVGTQKKSHSEGSLEYQENMFNPFKTREKTYTMANSETLMKCRIMQHFIRVCTIC